jgi:hypothetical protein
MKNIDNLISNHKKRNRNKNILSGIRKVIDITSSIASTLLLVKEKPKKLDYFSIGATLANVSLKIYDEISKLNTSDPQSFFDPKNHYIVPYSLEKTLFQFLQEQEILLVNDKISLNRGVLSGIEVFWIQKESTKERSFCKFEDRESLIMEIGKLLWAASGTNNITLDKMGELVSSDENLNFEVIETKAMKELEKRLVSFQKYGENGITRSYLLEGPPGTGKSSAAMHIIKKLGLKSLRASLASINEPRADGTYISVSANLEVLLNALQPDIIIIDDIDRGYVGEQTILKLFETARKYCKIIMATCNNKNSMIGAMLRVGRFDDHVEINRLDPEVVAGMLDEEDYDLAEKMSNWPIAYIQNYKTVKKVMGREQARLEIDDMENRIYEIERKSLNESNFANFTSPQSEIKKEIKKKKKSKNFRSNFLERNKEVDPPQELEPVGGY